MESRLAVLIHIDLDNATNARVLGYLPGAIAVNMHGPSLPLPCLPCLASQVAPPSSSIIFVFLTSQQ